MIRLRQTDDVEEIRALNALSFPNDKWIGDDHTFWVATSDDGTSAGYCSAVFRPEGGYVFLSRAAVFPWAEGQGLQRRMIRTRVRWAKTLQGCNRVITYTSLKNYQSMVNLLRCGFRFYTPPMLYVGEQYHYFELPLTTKDMS